MEEFFRQMGEMLVGRVHGPLAFRIVLQPLASAIIAGRAGWRDAGEGRPPYGWAVITNAIGRHELLRQCWNEVARVFVVAVVIDLVYEVTVFHRIYPGQSLIVAVLFAFLPYPFVRGTLNRIVSRWRRGHVKVQHAS